MLIRTVQITLCLAGFFSHAARKVKLEKNYEELLLLSNIFF